MALRSFVEGGVHFLMRVIRRCVFYHRDLVAEFGGKSNGRFDAGMRYEPDNDELIMILSLRKT